MFLQTFGQAFNDAFIWSVKLVLGPLVRWLDNTVMPWVDDRTAVPWLVAVDGETAEFMFLENIEHRKLPEFNAYRSALNGDGWQKWHEFLARGSVVVFNHFMTPLVARRMANISKRAASSVGDDDFVHMPRGGKHAFRLLKEANICKLMNQYVLEAKNIKRNEERLMTDDPYVPFSLSSVDGDDAFLDEEQYHRGHASKIDVPPKCGVYMPLQGYGSSTRSYDPGLSSGDVETYFVPTKK
jgi:hypothetical protein